MMIQLMIKIQIQNGNKINKKNKKLIDDKINKINKMRNKNKNKNKNKITIKNEIAEEHSNIITTNENQQPNTNKPIEGLNSFLTSEDPPNTNINTITESQTEINKNPKLNSISQSPKMEEKVKKPLPVTEEDDNKNDTIPSDDIKAVTELPNTLTTPQTDDKKQSINDTKKNEKKEVIEETNDTMPLF